MLATAVEFGWRAMANAANTAPGDARLRCPNQPSTWLSLLLITLLTPALASRPGDEPKRFAHWETRATAAERTRELRHWLDTPFRGAAAWQPQTAPLHGQQRRATGRVTRVRREFDASQGVQVLWLGASSGGLWRQVGSQWTPLSDRLPGSPAVGDFLIRPDGRILIASGDPWRYAGDGIWRSDDDGQSWQAAALPVQPASIYRIAIDSSDQERIWAATPDGLLRSNDGGASFVLRLSGHFSEIVQDPLQPQRWYAASQPHGLLRSDNGGDSFQADLPPGFLPMGALGRIRIAPSAAELGLVFAMVCDNGNTTGIWRRRGEGDWENIHPGADFGWGQSFHTCALTPHPTDPDWLAAGAGGAELTRNATAALPDWIPFSSGHSDTTGFLWDEGMLLASNDGGLYRIDPVSLDLDDSPIGTGLALGQVMGSGALALADGGIGVASVGYQDNGVARVRFAGDPMFAFVGESDASWLSIAPDNPERVAAVIGLPFRHYLSLNGGLSFGPMTCPLGDHNSSLPIVFDSAPGNTSPTRLYYTRGPAGDIRFARMNLSATCTSASQSIAITGSDNFRADHLDVARDPDQLRAYVTDTASGSETRIARVQSPPGQRLGGMSLDWLDAPEARSGRAIVDPFRPERVIWWANRDGTRAALWINDARGEPGAWLNLSANLAAFGGGLTVHRPATDPSDPERLWLATSMGVLLRENGSWVRDQNGLPTVTDVVDIRSEIVPQSPPRHRLWLATYGRGLWWRETITDPLFADDWESP
ncbi:MAG: hypothetical protein KDI51_06150 [Xanthomonadales bacterium]|nr:hypothetical protein [Xanthomonadales bacterium]